MRNSRFHTLRTAALISASLALLPVTSSYAASSTAFPPTYAPVGAPRAYANLLATKVAWVLRKIAAARSLIAAAREGLTSKEEQTREDSQAEIDKCTAEINQYRADLVVLRGPANAAQKALLRRNVEAWISALDDEIRFLKGAAEEDAKKAAAANSKKEAEGHRAAETLDKDRAAADQTERDDLKSDEKAAGL